jgi:hypothetical protein
MNVSVRNYILTNESAVVIDVADDCVFTVDFGIVLSYASPLSFNTDSYIFTSLTVTSDSTVGAIAVVGWNVQSTASSTSSTRLIRSQTESQTATALSRPAGILATSTGSLRAANNAGESITLINDDSNPTGLSAGAKAGIGVGVAAGILIILALFAWIFILKRRSRKHLNADEKSTANPNDTAPKAYELGDSQINELHHTSPLSELEPASAPAHQAPVELNADWRRMTLR